MAGVLEYIKSYVPTARGATLDQMLAEPVVGYSITYPVGVVGMILAIALMQRIWKTDYAAGYAAEAHALHDLGVTNEPILNRTVRVTNPQVTCETIREMVGTFRLDAIFGRVNRGDQLMLVMSPFFCQSRRGIGSLLQFGAKL